ncbi:proto-oncogene tyrosine-protein kinase receptor Ret-like [Uloborus diversus]|uniref:proto-oncogene tyrosine-protein kinase receptor Ret-like n=1 Tax=Uloborus diversus TaxID=327109 RepID=UPI0024092610|nr:proto-oncogene tyrosine-protein kinase receptor Ret-like [Uloborus diversus]
MLSPHRTHAIRDFRGSTFALDIAATSTNLTSSGNSTHSTVVVTVSDDSLALPNCQPRPELCFPDNEIHFQVPEVIPSGTFLGGIKPIPYTKMCPQVDTQYLIHDVPKPRFRFPESSYNVSVIFDDKSLVTDRQNKQVVFHIHIYNTTNEALPNMSNADDFQVVRNIFRHSSHHARVAQPMEVRPHEGYFFRLSGEPTWGGLAGNRIFGVTPGTGIVYVRDEAALARSPDNIFRLQLTWRSKEEADRRCSLTLRVFDARVEPGHHFPSCALHATLETCQSSCGRGALDGFCRWRSAPPHSPGLSSRYATCSPNLATCPDGICDELEELDPLICPQDCAGHIRGEAVPGSLGKGIALSAAPCTCPGPKTCVCIRLYPSLKRDKKPKARSHVKELPADEPRTVPATPLEFHDEWSQCGSVCAAMIAVVSLVVTGLVLSAGFLNEDPLEFPRDRLILEEMIGEGEFGKVMKGKAMGIGGASGNTTVAVKMLKEDSCSSDKKDLLSEMNLLKDVSHPNVIRLLGACTNDAGPLYVIVEYAEHGSLILYLRRMRARYPEAGGDFRELLSFAWQVARGMQYLAEMKIVHRDLAARNILVASGKVMKISDFGLSRDVYERETYQKRSKGRVPVKWMALESLQDHLYTAKSDVWSFGILLWEIITLGGCPYPGVSTEQLFSSLKSGYRMSRPDDCPIPLYHLMTQCWREKPQDRPHFKELVAKIDVILRDSQIEIPDQTFANQIRHLLLFKTSLQQIVT